MKAGYDHSENKMLFEWISSRTDDAMIIEGTNHLTIVVLGTQARINEWWQNLRIRQVEWSNMGRVHGGFAKNVHEIIGREDQKGSLINRILAASTEGKTIKMMGHSRAVSIIQLIATLAVAHGANRKLFKIVGCAGPRVGNKRFHDEYEEMLGDRTFVLNGYSDPVRFLPPWEKTNGKITMIKLGGFHPKHLLKRYIKSAEEHEVQSQSI